jgi:prepilin-type N-terminal cleavage/methylation domain-containing protein
MNAPTPSERAEAPPRKNRAFTLIELLLCVSILSMVLASLFAYFHAGKRAFLEVRKRIEFEFPEQRLFELFGRDLAGFVAWRDRGLVLAADRLYFHVRVPGESIHRIDYVLRQGYRKGKPAWDVVRERRPAFPEDGVPVESVPIVEGCSRAAFEALAYARVPGPGFENEDDASDPASAPPNRFFTWNAWKHPFPPQALRVTIVRDGRRRACGRWLPEYRFSPRIEPLLEIDPENPDPENPAMPYDENEPA